ncbi:hypothetical protein H5410_010683 [Solanum commersonii]|uniref:Beta-hydroxyacyl-ACP dehydratase n=1 Tax=Solanum commersonii TaxID=4109 RepID=A0A9J6AM49_SOLCO|nr:hypothetical protein H5410_010683 [Solanum commersonii]
MCLDTKFFLNYYDISLLEPSLVVLPEPNVNITWKIMCVNSSNIQAVLKLDNRSGSRAMAQVGGLVMLQPEVGGSKQNFFFAGIDKVRFRKPVIAGDTLVMRMTLIKLQKRFGIAKMEGKAYVGGDVVCEGEFLMATGSE